MIDYIYNVLQPHDIKAFEDHVNNCGACKSELNDLLNVNRTLTSYSAPGFSLSKNALDIVKSRMQNRRKIIRLKFTTAAAAILIALMTTLYLTYLSSGKNDDSYHVNGWENKLSQINIPKNDNEKFMLLGKFIGTMDFELAWNKKKDAFVFLSSQPNLRICETDDDNISYIRLQKLIDHIFGRPLVIKYKRIQPDKSFSYIIII